MELDWLFTSGNRLQDGDGVVALLVLSRVAVEVRGKRQDYNDESVASSAEEEEKFLLVGVSPGEISGSERNGVESYTRVTINFAIDQLRVKGIPKRPMIPNAASFVQ